MHELIQGIRQAVYILWSLRRFAGQKKDSFRENFMRQSKKTVMVYQDEELFINLGYDKGLIVIIIITRHWLAQLIQGLYTEGHSSKAKIRRMKAWQQWHLTGVPCFVALCFVAPGTYRVSYKLKVCGNPVRSKCIGAIFPTAFVNFLSLCHILVILTISQTISLLLYLLWWSVISDLWCYYC